MGSGVRWRETSIYPRSKWEVSAEGGYHLLSEQLEAFIVVGRSQFDDEMTHAECSVLPYPLDTTLRRAYDGRVLSSSMGTPNRT